MSRYYPQHAIPVEKTIAFTGAAGLGAQGTVALFTVTGLVRLTHFAARVTEDLAGALATIAVGSVAQAGALMATTTATDLDASRWWTNGAIDVDVQQEAAAAIDVLLAADIVALIATADVTNGTITFYAEYVPLNTAGKIEAA